MNILKKQTISIGLCFALAVSTFSAFTPATAAAKAKLVKKKLTLTVGQKKKIAIKSKKKKAKYSFKASNKKASVSKSGVITAKKAGKVKIAVKEKLKKKTRKVGTITVTIKKKIAQNTTVPALNTPTPVVTATPAASPSNEPTAEPTATATATPTPKVTPTPFPENPEFSNIPKGYTAKNQANKGEVERFEYESTEYISDDESAKKTPIDRYAMVVLPKDYSKTKKYPVVYMLHGLSDTPESMVGNGILNDGAGTQYVVWNAIANGDVKECIVVYPCVCCNEEGKSNFNTDAKTASYYDYIINDLTKVLMPAINKEYSTLTGRENTAVCGFSMGGRETLNIGIRRPDLFSGIGLFNPAPGALDGGDMLTKADLKLADEYINSTYIQITKGATDTVVGSNPTNYYNALKAAGIPCSYYETMGGDPAGKGNGGHWATVYHHGLYNFLKRIFK
ncbi:MAG: alpha/beta hydrolase [Clostridium sp.]|jgi:S-formylglutathione hydrolase FrmB